MPARVTQGMMNTQLLRNLNANMIRNEKLMNQLATGRVINKPSDDPVGITFALRYRNELADTSQYRENVDSLLSQLEYTDTVLNQVTNVLKRVYELAVGGANGTNPPDAMNAYKEEVDELKEQLINLGNSKFNGLYIFNGEKTDVQPYDPATLLTQGTDTKVAQYMVSPGVLIPGNVTGNEVFGDPGEQDQLFRIMEELSTALGNSDHETVSNLLGKLDSRLSKVLAVQAEVGARMNRAELVEGRLVDLDLNLQSMQSKIEDADLAEVIIKLKMGESVYQSSLAVGARLITPTLIDFLK